MNANQKRLIKYLCDFCADGSYTVLHETNLDDALALQNIGLVQISDEDNGSYFRLSCSLANVIDYLLAQID